METTLGIDAGSSSIKISLMDISNGNCLMSVTMPQNEMPILSPQNGWAEQKPQIWWKYVCEGVKKIGAQHPLGSIRAIGIAYQMHGLVVVDKHGDILRPAIIWCDSRAVQTGRQAFEKIGCDVCLEHMLNSPGNFTASKLAWVKNNQPEIYSAIYKFMLPGDYIAYKLSGEISTTQSGLSEGILWDFKNNRRSQTIIDSLGIDSEMIPVTMPSLGIQCRTSKETEDLLGIKRGTPISYRAGDQPNNAFSLNVMDVGGIAATAGTSGVVYGVTDSPKPDSESRINTFLHVNHTAESHRYGVLLCINGSGIMNSWMRRLCCTQMSYREIDDMCVSIPPASEGVIVLPFGNGAERMLGNRNIGATVSNIDLNRHTKAHLLRATQEGIAFAFRYGTDIMKSSGVKSDVIRAGKANMFMSDIFRSTLSTLCNTKIELYNTDGSLGAARGAALGAGMYKDAQEAFSSLKIIDTTYPNNKIKVVLEEAYQRWCNELENKIQQADSTIKN